MTHYVVYVIVTEETHQEGQSEVSCHVMDVLSNYSEYLEVDPYIVTTATELKNEYEEYKLKNPDNQLSLEEYAVKTHYTKPNSEGHIMSTRNRDALFDWYQIGGRWDGDFNSENYVKISEVLDHINGIKQQQSCDDTDLDDCGYEPFDYNRILQRTIVDQNGKKYQCEKIGWWCISEQISDKDNHVRIIKELLEKNRNHYLYTIDCHI